MVTERLKPRVEVHVKGANAREVVVRRDWNGHSVVRGTVNGVDVELLLDTGASNVAIPPALARRLKLNHPEHPARLVVAAESADEARALARTRWYGRSPRNEFEALLCEAFSVENIEAPADSSG